MLEEDAASGFINELVVSELFAQGFCAQVSQVVVQGLERPRRWPFPLQKCATLDSVSNMKLIWSSINSSHRFREASQAGGDKRVLCILRDVITDAALKLKDGAWKRPNWP